MVNIKTYKLKASSDVESNAEILADYTVY